MNYAFSQIACNCYFLHIVSFSIICRLNERKRSKKIMKFYLRINFIIINSGLLRLSPRSHRDAERMTNFCL